MRYQNHSQRRDQIKVNTSGTTSPFTGYTRIPFSPTLNPEEVAEKQSAPPTPLMDLTAASTGLSQDISVGGVNHRQLTGSFTVPEYSVTSVSPRRILDNSSTLGETRQFCAALLSDMRASLRVIEERLRGLGA